MGTRLRDELQELRDELDAVRERERVLQRRVHQLDEFRALFATGMAHDIRTPLTAILGFAELLGGRWDQLDNDHRVRAVQSIREAASIMTGRVEELLEVARLEWHSLDCVEFPAERAIRTVLADLPSPQARRVHLDVPVDLPQAVGHEPSHERVLRNLVATALHLEADCVVEVRAWREEGDICVAVKEPQTTLNAEEAEHLFDRFMGLPASPDSPDSGIGLYVAMRLVEAQGGDLLLVPNEPKGVTFLYTLPCAGHDVSRATARVR